MGLYFMGVIHSSPFILPSFIFMALRIRPQRYGFVAGSLILFILFEDSSSTVLIKDLSSTLWICPLFSLFWFYPLSNCRFVYSDYRRLISIVIAWIRPLSLIKIGFMAIIIIFQFGFILALEGSCCVNCFFDRLSLPMVFPHDWFCQSFYFHCHNFVFAIYGAFFTVLLQTQYAFQVYVYAILQQGRLR